MKCIKQGAMVGLFSFAVAGSLFAGGGQQQPGGSGSGTQKPFEIVISHIVNEDNSWHKASLFFKEQLESRSGGRIKVNIHPNSELGTEMDAINSIMTEGGVDITFTGESMMSVIPEMGVIGVPYMISSLNHLEKTVNGPVGKKLEDLMLQKANMRSLGYFARGPRDITSNKPIRVPADLQGFNIRVPASPITVAAWEALGAKPTPMAFAEVFTALQQKTIDGQENPLAMIKTGNFYEVQSYLNKSEHLIAWVYIVMSETKFKSLPKDLQDLVLTVGKETQDYERKIFLQEEQELEQFMKDHSMTIVADVDKAAFAAQASAGIERVLKERTEYANTIYPLYQQIKAAP
jgi:tripartite ATP-independent transporter DctP family solute receptor